MLFAVRDGTSEAERYTIFTLRVPFQSISIVVENVIAITWLEFIVQGEDATTLVVFF